MSTRTARRTNTRQNPKRSLADFARGMSWVASLAVLLSVLGGLWWGTARLLHPESLPIRRVAIDGPLHYLSEDRVRSAIAPHLAAGFFKADVRAIHQALMAEPWVKTAAVRRLWPDTLRVTLREQEPVARWGRSGFVNAEGEVFVPNSGPRLLHLVQLNGPSGTATQVLEKIKILRKMLAPTRRQVVALELNERRAYSFKLAQGQTVVVGRNGFEERVKQFLAIFDQVFAQGVDQLEKVDLRYSNGFAVRWKPQAKEGLIGKRDQQANGEKNG
jgi:cell division protein FtsQ